jgi:AraC family transcriptional regulator
MDDIQPIQRVIDRIDERIKEALTVGELADFANFSHFYFCRVFRAATGLPVMLYVTRRKLQFALYDLSRGRKIIDVAMEYGFETHAGFTKAFKRCFGYPPSLYRLHAGANPPQRLELKILRNKLSGGILMHLQIIESKPVTIVGFAGRHVLPNVQRTHDAPAYWDSINMEYSAPLSRLHDTFAESKHCECAVCYDVDIGTGEFTYLLGVGVDNEDLAKIEPDMQKLELQGGLYAVFTTPLVPDAQYTQSIRDTWSDILLNWLPGSEYEFDEERLDFEYYDQRDHGSMAQMDIFIPVRKRV